MKFSYSGHTLIEFMVVITASLLLLSVLMMAFTAVKMSSSYVDNLISAQESMLIFFQSIKNDLHQTSVEILDPEKIPVAVKSRIAVNTNPLLVKENNNQILYFVSKTNNIYQLHRKNLSQSAYLQDALTNNIDSLKIKYYQWVGKKLECLSAAQVTDWKAIALIQIQFSVVAANRQKGIIKKLHFILGIKE